MTHSADPDQDRDQAAIDWLMTHNFRDDVEMGCDPTMDPGVCHELRYQHRGYAKYVDVADLFGWDKLGAANRVIYDRWLADGGINFTYDKEFVSDDEYLRAMGDALRVNPMPLFHFWGVRGSAEVEAELARLPHSPEIYRRLQHYKALVPRTKAQFQPWYDLNRPKVDPVHFDRYDWALANWDSEELGQKAVSQINNVVRTWYPANYDPDAASFVPNAGLNDAWFNLATPGQGLFVTVYPGLNLVFVAMFTFDAQDADGNATAVVGGPNQRWLTAIGPISGNRAVLEVELTTGGLFDSGTPKPDQLPEQGTFTLEFLSCDAIRLDYELADGTITGSVDYQRVVADNAALCADLAADD